MPNLQGLRLSRRDSCLHWEPGLGPWKKVCHNRYDNTIQVPHTEEAPPAFTSEVTSPCSFKQLLRNNAQHLEVRVQTLVPPPAPVCLHLSQAVSHCFPGLQGCPKRRVSMLLFLPSLPTIEACSSQGRQHYHKFIMLLQSAASVEFNHGFPFGFPLSQSTQCCR